LKESFAQACHVGGLGKCRRDGAVMRQVPVRERGVLVTGGDHGQLFWLGPCEHGRVAEGPVDELDTMDEALATEGIDLRQPCGGGRPPAGVVPPVIGFGCTIANGVSPKQS